MTHKPPQPGTEAAPYTMGMRITVTLTEHSAKALNLWLSYWREALDTPMCPRDSTLISYALARGAIARANEA